MVSLIDKAKAIKLLILDVDGVLTNGLIYYGTVGSQFKGFHIQDGLGIKLLQRAGIQVGVISAKNVDLVAKRLQDLTIEHCYLGYEDKVPPYEALKKKLQLNDTEVAYMGDDLPDLPLLRRAGLAITVPKAPAIIHQHIDLMTKNHGGAGAVREVCEFILEAKDLYQSVIQSYLTK